MSIRQLCAAFALSLLLASVIAIFLGAAMTGCATSPSGQPLPPTPEQLAQAQAAAKAACAVIPALAADKTVGPKDLANAQAACDVANAALSAVQAAAPASAPAR